MSVTQMKWRAAVLAVTVIAVFTALFALSTMTSDAADVIKDDETHTYTMSDSTYDQQICLEEGTTTTIKISGENKLTYGGQCISGNGDLVIIGNGTLDVSGGYIDCKDFTMSGGAKLIIGYDLSADGKVSVDNAEIESAHGGMVCGRYDDETQKHTFRNAGLKLGMKLYGDTVLTDCNVTLENGSLSSQSGELTIDGGIYNITQDTSELYPAASLYARLKAVIKNAVIKTNSYSMFWNLEMTDSTFEITIPPGPGGLASPAIWGDNLVFVGSKVKIGGNALAGIVALDQLTMAGFTEVNISGLYFGIVGKDVHIKHSGGKIRATDPAEATAAVSANTIGFFSEGPVDPGTITLTAVNVKEPAGYTIAEISTAVRPKTISNGPEATITTILEGKDPAKTVVLEIGHSWDAGTVTKEPTETAEGVKTYTCDICGATKTEAIPKLTPQTPQKNENGADGTPFGKGASVAAAEAAILALPNDNDPAGTAFGLLQLKASKVTKNSINLTWKAVPGASKYILFANKCGTGNKYKKLGEVTGTSFTATQAAGAAIQKGTYYKFMMIAADANGKVISTSKTVHAATKGGKVGNHKKVTVKKSVTKKAKKLKKGKTLKLKAKAVPQAKKLKVRKHRGIKYESSNPAVAQVNGKGTVKGVTKGTCYIYAYAQNGTCAKVKATVK